MFPVAGRGQRADVVADPAGTEAVVQKKVLPAAEQDRPDVPLRRQAWQAEMIGLPSDQLVFLDETWTKTNFTRLVASSIGCVLR